MVVFGEKKILNAKFSIADMRALSDRSEARKYFILRYFLPLVYNMWQENPSLDDWMLCHICCDNGIYFPNVIGGREESQHITFANNDVRNVRASSQQRDAAKRICEVPFTESELSTELRRVFDECFPIEKDYCLSTNTSPLIVTFQKVRQPTNAGITPEYSMNMNVVLKIRDKLKRSNVLTAQIYSRNSFDLIKMSEKYGRTYNAITGVWDSLCNDPECPECSMVKKSPAAANAYDDASMY